jgi:hypothetical protein
LDESESEGEGEEEVETARKMSFKVGIITRQMTDGSWAFNALRFSRREDAERYSQDLFSRWNQVKSCTIEECDDDPNATYPVPSDRYEVER